MLDTIFDTFSGIFGNYLFCLERYWLYALVILTSAPTAFFVYLAAALISLGILYVGSYFFLMARNAPAFGRQRIMRSRGAPSPPSPSNVAEVPTCSFRGG